MEKFKLTLKMLRYNRKSYKMYLYCNVFAVALFSSFISIYNNDSFMNNAKIDSSISSNVFAPTVLMGMFMVLFIPYAYMSFLKGRKQEYAVLMVLGMTEFEVIINMFWECLMVSIVGGAIGILIGSGLSFTFFVFLCDIIGLSSVQWEYHIETYKVTAVIYVCTVIIILCINVMQLIKTEILELFKDKYNEEKRKRGSKYGLFLGIGIICIGVLLMVSEYNFNRTYMCFFCIAISIVGLAIIILNFDVLMKKLCKKSWKISISLVLQNIKSWRIVVFISTCLFGILVFFLGHSMVAYPNFENNAMTYSPYDLFYVKYQEINNIEMGQIENILNKNEIFITEKKEVEILRNGFCNIINVDEINEKLGQDYQVEEGEFIQLFQADLNDGYKHDIHPMQSFSVDFEDGRNMQLRLKECDIKVVFNTCKSLADITLIISDKDFQKIKISSKEYLNESAVMINFDDWTNSGSAIEEIQRIMEESNGLAKEDQYLYNIASKIERYTVAKQSSGVLVFFMFFVALVFWGAANATIFFKIRSELKEEKHTILNLYGVGIVEKEIRTIILKKNFFYYFIPLIIGDSWGIFFSYSVNAIYGYGRIGLLCGGLVTFIMCIMQLIVFYSIIKGEYNEVSMF